MALLELKVKVREGFLVLRLMLRSNDEGAIEGRHRLFV